MWHIIQLNQKGWEKGGDKQVVLVLITNKKKTNEISVTTTERITLISTYEAELEREQHSSREGLTQDGTDSRRQWETETKGLTRGRFSRVTYCLSRGCDGYMSGCMQGYIMRWLTVYRRL